MIERTGCGRYTENGPTIFYQSLPRDHADVVLQFDGLEFLRGKSLYTLQGLRSYKVSGPLFGSYYVRLSILQTDLRDEGWVD
jgi:hypothetical protein